MESRVIFLAIVAIFVQKCTSTCTDEFNGFKRCVRDQMTRDKNDVTANEDRRKTVENEFRSCCTQSGCLDPYPDQKERQSREFCFGQSRTTVRQSMEQCVRQQHREFQLPEDDNDKDAYWNFLMLRTFAAMKNVGNNRYNPNRGNKNKWSRMNQNQPANEVCGTDDSKKSKVSDCVKTKGTFNHTAAKSNWRRNSCRIKRNCNQVTQQCQQNWDDNYKPNLCNCVNKFRTDGTLQKVQDQYTRCLRQRGVRAQNEQYDDGRVIVGSFLTDWCANNQTKSQASQSDPCNRTRSGSRGQNGQNNQNANVNANANVQTDAQVSSSGYDDGSVAPTQDVSPLSGMLGGTDPFGALPSTGGGGDLLSMFTGGAGGLPSLGGGLPNLGGGGGLPFGLGGGGSGGLGGGLLNGLGGGGGGLPFGLGGGGGPAGLIGANPLGGGGLGAGLLGGAPAGGDLLGGLGAGGGMTDMLGGLGGMGNLMGAMGSFGKKK